MVLVATDNRNRTVAEIRHLFSKHGGNMGEVGSVGWMFERKSQIVLEKELATEDQLMEFALEAGADDVRDQGDSWEILSAPDAHNTVVDALAKAKMATLSAEIAMIPKNLHAVDAKHSGGMMRIMDFLDEHEDVQNVYTNADFGDEEDDG